MITRTIELLLHALSDLPTLQYLLDTVFFFLQCLRASVAILNSVTSQWFSFVLYPRMDLSIFSPMAKPIVPMKLNGIYPMSSAVPSPGCMASRLVLDTVHPPLQDASPASLASPLLLYGVFVPEG